MSHGRDGERGRASRRTGGAHDFRGHRAYTPGDEPRTIDWAAFGRTDQLVVRTFARESESTVRIVLDRTASMGVDAKARRSVEVAAAVAWLALVSGHRVTAVAAAAGGVRPLGTWASPGELRDALAAFDALPPCGGADYSGGVGAWLGAARGPGACVLITDGVDEPRLDDVLERVGRVTRDGSLFHVFAARDVDPGDGACELTDAETGETLRIDVDTEVRRAVASRVEAWRRHVEASCRKRRVAYRALAPHDTLEDAIIAWHRDVAHDRR